MTDVCIIQFLESDYMMKDLRESLQEEGVKKDEIISILSFLGSFAVNCRKAGLEDLADIFSNRVNSFAYILHTLGYKHGKRMKGSTTSGIETIISQAYYNLGNEETKNEHRRI